MSALTLTLVAGTTPITVDVSKPIDISLHITPNEQVNAFFLPRATFVPYRNGSFVPRMAMERTQSASDM
jgi:hypothetical protein